MLVLSRKIGERIVIGDDVVIIVNRISGNRVSIGVEAPAEVKVIRGELKRFRDQFAEGETTDVARAAGLDVGDPSLSYVARTAR